MNLHRMIVTDMHRVEPRSNTDYRSDALPVSRHLRPWSPGLAIQMINWLAGLLINTGRAMQRAIQADVQTPKSSRYIYS